MATRNVAGILREVALIQSSGLSDDAKARLIGDLHAEAEAIASQLRLPVSPGVLAPKAK